MRPSDPHQKLRTGNRFEQLRLDAEARLKAGADGPNYGWTLSPDALSRLYHLASSSDSAGDALKLLHELQTHQVELDIQHEQLEASEHQAAQDLIFYRTLFDSAPVAYFIIGLDGHIIACNEAAAELLGSSDEQLCGQPLSSMLSSSSRPALNDCLKQLRESGFTVSCAVQPLEESHGNGGCWQVHGRIAPSKEAILLTLSPQDRLNEA